MITHLKHLSSSHVKTLKDLIAVIAADIQPEKIICYGARSKVAEMWSSFSGPVKAQADAVYDLLIITRKNKNKWNAREIIDKIHSYKIADARITVLVHSISAVTDALKDGSPFFATVINNGAILYDHSGSPLISPLLKPDAGDRLQHTVRLWDKWFRHGQQFLEGACYFSSAGHKNLSVFMLHQAVEHTSIGLVSVCTGYRPATHNLGRLLHMTENFTSRLMAIFPQNTPEEIDLFNTLAKSYADARYQEGFTVDEGKIRILTERIITFQHEAERIYKEQIAQMQGCRENCLSNELQNSVAYEN
jgi:uncharacterized protein